MAGVEDEEPVDEELCVDEEPVDEPEEADDVPDPLARESVR